jgi:hypothetical protein
LDAYYQYSFNNPKSQSIPVDYNNAQDAPTLTLGQFDANLAPPTAGGFGAHVTLITGHTAQVDKPGGQESRFQSVMQAYITGIGKTGYGVDFGEFYTPFGYESDNDSNLNFNYSFSDVYADLLPVYNAGFRFYTPTIWNGWVFKAYVVNALNNTGNEGIHDDNNSKGLFGVASYTDPKGKWTGTENYGFSHDQDVNFGSLVSDLSDTRDTDDTTLSDTDLTFTPNSKWTVGLEYVYREDTGTNTAYTLDSGGTVPDDTTSSDNGTYTTTNTSESVISHGYAAYLVDNLTALTDLAFRYSDVAQKALGNPYDLTLTYAIKSSDSKWLTKFEYRYDNISEGLDFEDSSGNFTKTSNNTVTVGEVFTF